MNDFCDDWHVGAWPAGSVTRIEPARQGHAVTLAGHAFRTRVLLRPSPRPAFRASA
jgi:hypothetical protein